MLKCQFLMSQCSLSLVHTTAAIPSLEAGFESSGNALLRNVSVKGTKTTDLTWTFDTGSLGGLFKGDFGIGVTCKSRQSGQYAVNPATVHYLHHIPLESIPANALITLTSPFRSVAIQTALSPCVLPIQPFDTA